MGKHEVGADANVVLSAALRDGFVRRSLAAADADLFAPSFLQTELDKHLPAIARRAGVRVADARTALGQLLGDVVWVKPRAIQAKWDEAHRTLDKVDKKDGRHLACTLAVEADAIGSDDKALDAKKLVARVTLPTTD